MKPAPPVTNKLATFHLRKNAAQSFTPVYRGKPERDQGCLVQHAVGRPACRSWIIRRGDWCHDDILWNETQQSPLLRNCDCEIVPAGHTSIGPMVNPTDA